MGGLFACVKHGLRMKWLRWVLINNRSVRLIAHIENDSQIVRY